MFGLGVQELMIIFLIIIVLFGAKKLPELAGGLGKGIKEFKKATKEVEEDDQQKIDEGEKKESE
ncbi:Sec-independent protein translocase TatA [candidate division KSB1 bacterium 4572_119]|nr:MAG: Sec-independent protein translocase TatA [candidate division KSB1 bacterium 4572_119]